MRIELEGGDARLGYFAWALEQSGPTQPVAEYLSTAQEVDVEGIADWMDSTVNAELNPYIPGWEEPWAYEKRLREGFWPSDRWLREVALGRNPSTATPADYVAYVGRPPWAVNDLAVQLGADERGPQLAIVEEAAYRAMLLAFLGMLGGSTRAESWLIVLMVRGGLNRQLTISHFLSTATHGRIGNSEMEVPRSGQVMEWAEALRAVYTPREQALAQMVSEYVARRRPEGP